MTDALPVHLPWVVLLGFLRLATHRQISMAGTTAQLRFEYTQDAAGTCTRVRPGHSCGVLVDNIVVKSVTSAR